jgi:molybdopterin molybdotransferase
LAIATTLLAGSSLIMDKTQPLRGTLTSLDSTLANLCDRQVPVEPIPMPLDKASGYVAAEMPALGRSLPAQNMAVLDGWALCSLDLAGASHYSPVPLSQQPRWVETGEALPEGCDCVLRSDLVEQHGPLMQALAEASPGQGARRAGEDIAARRPLVLAGRRLCAADLLVLNGTGCGVVMVRSPVLSLINLAPSDGARLTAEFIATLAREAGARVKIETATRDVQAITKALAHASGDLVVLVGGTGGGRTDCVAQALANAGTLIAHGIALQPGETTAAARCGAAPVVALPGLPAHALAAYLLLVQPLIDLFSARLPRQGVSLPLSRKIASAVGIAEVALVCREADTWQALAVGDLSLDHIRMADAWLAVGGDSEGYAAGVAVEAFPLWAM